MRRPAELAALLGVRKRPVNSEARAMAQATPS
jgi:hypothetical protein